MLTTFATAPNVETPYSNPSPGETAKSSTDIVSQTGDGRTTRKTCLYVGLAGSMSIVNNRC